MPHWNFMIVQSLLWRKQRVLFIYNLSNDNKKPIKTLNVNNQAFRFSSNKIVFVFFHQSLRIITKHIFWLSRIFLYGFSNSKDLFTKWGKKNRIGFQTIFFNNRCNKAGFYFYSGKKTDAGTFYFKTLNNIFQKLCLYGYFIKYYSSQAIKLGRKASAHKVDFVSSLMYETYTFRAR